MQGGGLGPPAKSLETCNRGEADVRTLMDAIALAATLLLLDSSLPTDARAFGGACVAAVNVACGDVKPRVGPIRACFEKHLERLSGPCASKLSRAADAAQECEADVKKFCGAVRRAAEIADCMKPRLGEVSRPCKGALAKVAIPFAFLR